MQHRGRAEERGRIASWLSYSAQAYLGMTCRRVDLIPPSGSSYRLLISSRDSARRHHESIVRSKCRKRQVGSASQPSRGPRMSGAPITACRERQSRRLGRGGEAGRRGGWEWRWWRWSRVKAEGTWSRARPRESRKVFWLPRACRFPRVNSASCVRDIALHVLLLLVHRTRPHHGGRRQGERSAVRRSGLHHRAQRRHQHATA